MANENHLDGKKILVVDDEPDVLASLEELLTMCNVVAASSFDEAKEKLESQDFDIAILDIMGVDGYKLLDIANNKGIITVMLTAHALSPEDTIKSFKEGAASYVPKDKMADITTYLNDIYEAKGAGEKPWFRWLERFTNFYMDKFGADWQDGDKEFWERYLGRN